MTDYQEPHGPEWISAVRVGNKITPRFTNLKAFLEGAKEFISLADDEGDAAEGALQTQADQIAKLELKLKNIRGFIEGRDRFTEIDKEMASLYAVLGAVLEEASDDNHIIDLSAQS